MHIVRSIAYVLFASIERCQKVAYCNKICYKLMLLNLFIEMLKNKYKINHSMHKRTRRQGIGEYFALIAVLNIKKPFIYFYNKKISLYKKKYAYNMYKYINAYINNIKVPHVCFHSCL